MSLFRQIFKPDPAVLGSAARVAVKEPGSRSRMRGWLHVGRATPLPRGGDWGMESALPHLALNDAPLRFQR